MGGGKSVPTRALDQQDLPACLALADSQGWPPEEAKWRFLLDVGCGFGIDDPEGRGLAGAVIVTPYGGALAAVGMLLVVPHRARRGLGQHLMEHVLDVARVSVVLLYSTSQGRRLYERLGFEVVDSVVKHVGEYRPGPGDPGIHVRPFALSDAASVRDLDHVATGADRSRILDRLSAFARQVVVALTGDELVGFAASWANLGELRVGPVIALNDHAAQGMVHSLLREWRGPVRIDIPPRFQQISEWAEERGLLPLPPDPMMATGALPGERQKLYAPVMQALG
jgi:GNAT superfamily N-acetyltransferase